MSYIVECGERVHAPVVLVVLGREVPQHRVQQQRQARDPLHRQHQERVQRQALARRVTL